MRQTPLGQGKWEEFDFTLDNQTLKHADAWVVFESLDQVRKVSCSPDRLIFIAGEPSSLSNYHRKFLKQFSHVVMSKRDVKHPHVLFQQQGQPWFVEKSFDELVTMTPVFKTKGICIIVSDKAFTPGHSKRLQFVHDLKERLGERVDVWGRGIADFNSKWDLLKEYRYAVVLENSMENDYLSEKLPDAWLAYCLPFYAGCPNADHYFSSKGFVKLDLSDVDAAVQKLLLALEDESIYIKSLPKILECRHEYLLRQQFFPNLVSILQEVLAKSKRPARKITLRPNSYFQSKSKIRGLTSFISNIYPLIIKLLKFNNQRSL